ncbi:DNA polymerase III subunit beta [Amycolatopsis albispora]|uniref:DNA polymerase III subunit beta n=1 Tax=Amycolatopsis albispora TaxID=1804986 RepID=A0A344LCE4_9PSEU|nr:DNA polymerase III subunit beta [Amycolatopsis albispora]AXB45718.1 DNA polymerase III subunit beta [Amycolatopsis albispora]
MDLTASTPALAAALADAVRLLPSGGPGLLLRADAHGLVLAGNDHERPVRLACTALTHTDGEVLVPARPLAETVKVLDEPEVRLVVEGSRLAIRTARGRFALPLLDRELYLDGGELPVVGEIDGALLSRALAPVSATAARDDALPMFTGVRVSSSARGLSLLASDRFRMAAADLPWTGGEVDALVPAGLLAEVGKQVSGTVAVHADVNRFGLSWGRSTVATAVLDGGFLTEGSISMGAVETRLTVAADELAAAVRRTSLYAGPRGVVTLDVQDGTIRVAGTDPRAGEAEELVKSTVDGNRAAPSYQARYLLDALRPFSGGDTTLALQPGLRATLLTADSTPLRYYVMPMQPPVNVTAGPGRSP